MAEKWPAPLPAGLYSSGCWAVMVFESTKTDDELRTMMQCPLQLSANVSQRKVQLLEARTRIEPVKETPQPLSGHPSTMFCRVKPSKVKLLTWLSETYPLPPPSMVTLAPASGTQISPLSELVKFQAPPAIE